METLGLVLDNVEPGQLLLVWGVVIMAAVLRAFSGFGFGLAAVPVFALFMPPTQAVVLSTALTLAISLLTFRTYWGGYPLQKMLPMLALLVVGTGCGAAVLSQISPGQFRLWIGLLVITACIVLGLYRPREREPGAVLGGFTGLLSGLMNGAFAIPGPPVIIYAMATQPDGHRSRSLLMTFFLFSSLLALFSFGIAGFITPVSPWLFLLAFPAMYIGDKLGYTLFRRFGSAFYRRVALGMLFALGIAITARALI